MLLYALLHVITIYTWCQGENRTLPIVLVCPRQWRGMTGEPAAGYRTQATGAFTRASLVGPSRRTSYLTHQGHASRTQRREAPMRRHEFEGRSGARLVQLRSVEIQASRGGKSPYWRQARALRVNTEDEYLPPGF